MIKDEDDCFVIIANYGYCGRFHNQMARSNCNYLCIVLCTFMIAVHLAYLKPQSFGNIGCRY